MTIDFFEAARQRSQAELDQARTMESRNRAGQYDTPQELADTLVRLALAELPTDEPVYFLEPGLGTGTFFSALTRNTAPGRVHRAKGVELDPDSARVAASLWRHTGLEVEHADFTTLELDPDAPPYNLIVCNPPYVRHHHIDRATKDALKRRVRAQTGVTLSGRAGLYCYFILLAKAHWAEDGVSLWLVPSEFMDVNYGAEVKAFLSDQTTILRVHRFDAEDVQFDDALVTSTVLVLKNAPPTPDHEVLFTRGTDLGDPRERYTLTQRDLDPNDRWARPGEVELEAAPDGADSLKLGDLFSARRGVATGANKFFILPLLDAVERGLPRELLLPILPSPRYVTEDVIEADPNGFPVLPRKLALLACDLEMDDLQIRWPRVAEYLAAGMERGVHEGYLCRHRNPWYSQEKRLPTPFVCTYMGRGKAGGPPLRFIHNRSQAIATNVYLMLTLRSPIAEVPHPVIFNALTDLVTSGALSRSGRVYGGGLKKVEPGELLNLTLPERWRDLTTTPSQETLL